MAAITTSACSRGLTEAEVTARGHPTDRIGHRAICASPGAGSAYALTSTTAGLDHDRDGIPAGRDRARITD